MEKEIKKSCADCTYFRQYYTKDKTRFRKAGDCGQCVKPNGHYRKTENICKDFVEKDIEKIEEEQLKSVTELLSNIAEKISKLQEVFKE